MKTWKSACNLNLRIGMVGLSLNLCCNNQLWNVAQEHSMPVFDFSWGVNCWKQNGLWRQTRGAVEGLVCLLQNSLTPLILWERSLCLRERLCQLKHLTQKQGILETCPLSCACFRAFNGENRAVCNAQDTPFPMTRPEALLWSGGHMPGWSLTSMLPSSSSTSHITERNHASL